MFFTQIHKLKGAPEETRMQLAARVEKTIIEREMLLHDVEMHKNYKDLNFELEMKHS